MSGDYYDRQGRLVDLWEWADLGADEAYKRVADTTLVDGTWISTIWLGLDHSWGKGPPLIFETMVFPCKGPSVGVAQLMADPSLGDDWREQECWRWPTEAAAITGHDQVVAKITEALERLADAVSGLAAPGDGEGEAGQHDGDQPEGDDPGVDVDH